MSYHPSLYPSIFVHLLFMSPIYWPGEGNGSPLQHSCLENPADRGDWRAAVHGVARSQTRLKRLSMRLLTTLLTFIIFFFYIFKQNLLFPIAFLIKEISILIYLKPHKSNHFNTFCPLTLLVDKEQNALMLFPFKRKFKFRKVGQNQMQCLTVFYCFIVLKQNGPCVLDIIN